MTTQKPTFEEIDRLTSHPWENDKAIVITRHTLYGELKYRKSVVDFELIRVERGGLLESIIRDAPCPVHPAVANSFLRVIMAAAKETKLNSILSTPPALLADRDAIELARFADHEVDTWRRRDKYQAFIHAWTFFRYSRQSLATGQLIGDLRVVSQHAGTPQTIKQLISDTYDGTFDDPTLAGPIGALQFDDLTERKAAAIRHLQARLDNIKGACKEVIANHLQLVERIKHLKRLGIPNDIPKNSLVALSHGGRVYRPTLSKLPSEEALRVILHVIERDKWYVSFPRPHEVSHQHVDTLRASIPIPLRLSPLLVLVSDHFLPYHVVFACLILLGTSTAWNPTTLFSLGAESVRKTARGYEITGLKTKTDQLQSAELQEDLRDEQSEQTTQLSAIDDITAIELLLRNLEQAKKHGLVCDDKLFIRPSARGNVPLRFIVPRVSRELREFCEFAGIKPFTLHELRDQVANLRYMTGGEDANVVRALLGHASLNVTGGYLATTILRALHESNMRRFMKILAKSVLYAVGRENWEDDLTESQDAVARRLLFPVSHLIDDELECEVDIWLKSSGTLQMVIGWAEVQHCAMQRQYYLNHMRALTQANPERFLKHHLPRIVICYALYRLIQTSPHRALLSRYEVA
jgi:hypothetical protein